MKSLNPLSSKCKVVCMNYPSYCNDRFFMNGTVAEVEALIKIGEVKCPTCGGTCNHAQEQFDAPYIGGPATICHWSDCDSATVIAISPSGKTVTVQKDSQKILNAPNSNEPDALVTYPGGFVGHTVGDQRWATEPDPEGITYKFRLQKDGRWQMPNKGSTVIFNGRYPHYDFNF
jgi:hypothetical protein